MQLCVMWKPSLSFHVVYTSKDPCNAEGLLVNCTKDRCQRHIATSKTATRTFDDSTANDIGHRQLLDDLWQLFPGVDSDCGLDETTSSAA